jgi:hypothetical protein
MPRVRLPFLLRPVRLAGAVLLLLLLPAGLRAQVGHAPESSPYRDIRHGSYLLAVGGIFSGSGGAAGVAPHDGNTGGLRWIFLGNRPLSVGLGVTYGDLSRLIQDPVKPPDTRTTGPVPQRVVFADLALQFNLTGGKTWRGIAPFTGAAAGLAFTEQVPGDPTTYKTGNKFYLAPMAGTRIFLGSAFYLHLEARYLFWQLKYPVTFREAQDASNTPVLPTGDRDEWVATPWLQAGLGFKFSLPF